MTVHALPGARRRANAKAPLRIGDVWVLIGPGTEVVIVALKPRPTAQKPDAMAVTLNDGRTIAEATLRYGYRRWPEYLEFLEELGYKLRAMFPERAAARGFGQVIQFPGKRTT